MIYSGFIFFKAYSNFGHSYTAKEQTWYDVYSWWVKAIFLSSCWWHCQGSSTVQSFQSLRCATRNLQTLVKMSIAGLRSNSTCRCYCRVLICTVGNGFYKLSEIVSCKLNGLFPLKHVLFNVRLQESDYDLVKILGLKKCNIFHENQTKSFLVKSGYCVDLPHLLQKDHKVV